MWGRAADGRRSRSPRSKSTLFIVYHNKSFLARATAQLLVWGACPTFHAPAASSRPLSLVLTSKSLGPVTSSVALNPLILVSLIHLLLRLQQQQPAPRRRGHCLSLFLATPRKRAAAIIIHPSVLLPSSVLLLLSLLLPLLLLPLAIAWATRPESQTRFG